MKIRKIYFTAVKNNFLQWKYRKWKIHILFHQYFPIFHSYVYNKSRYYYSSSTSKSGKFHITIFVLVSLEPNTNLINAALFLIININKKCRTKHISTHFHGPWLILLWKINSFQENEQKLFWPWPTGPIINMGHRPHN